MKKQTLCVIFGGKSSEYEVSLASVYSVLSHIDREKYELVRLGITKDGEWYIFEGEDGEILNDTWHRGSVVPVAIDMSTDHLLALDRGIYAIHIDIFLPLLHGEYGEDGRVQGLLDTVGARYIGCDSFSSHLCMDKGLTKKIARELGIAVAEARVVRRGQDCRKILDKLTYPVFIKPCMAGSSVGACKADNRERAEQGIERAFKYCSCALIEEYIRGREIELAVMEKDGELIVTRAGEIGYGGEFYDYDTKYRSKDVEYIIPAKIDEKTEKYLQECAKRLFYSLGCRDLCRVDFFLTDGGEVIFNEVNTMPGFTESSMFPMLMRDMGYSMGEIIDSLVENTIVKF